MPWALVGKQFHLSQGPDSEPVLSGPVWVWDDSRLTRTINSVV